MLPIYWAGLAASASFGLSRSMALPSSCLLFAFSVGLLMLTGQAVFAAFATTIAALEAVRWLLLPQSLALRVVSHGLTMWLLPIVSMWGLIGAIDDKSFFSQEVGHAFNSTFEFTVLFLVPLLIMRTAESTGGGDVQLKLMRSEGVALVLAGFGGGTIEAVVVWLRDRPQASENPEFWTPDVDYHHILTSFMWGTWGLLGLVAAAHCLKTDLHVAGGAVMYGVVMLGHARMPDIGSDGAMDATASKDMEAWLLLHRATAALFICGGVMRIIGRRFEASVIFFLAALTFTVAAKQVCHALTLPFRTGHVAVMAVAPVVVFSAAVQICLVLRIADEWSREQEGRNTHGSRSAARTHDKLDAFECILDPRHQGAHFTLQAWQNEEFNEN